MEDGTRELIDLLYKELVRVKAKSRATDEWVYRFVSIGVVPFFFFLGYCAVNSSYRILLTALPYLSTLGFLLVMNLWNHYSYSSHYGRYLEERINRLLGGEELLDSSFSKIYYEDWRSLVPFTFILSIALLFALNVVAFPVITTAINTFCTSQQNAICKSCIVSILVKNFWCFTIPFSFLVVAMSFVSVFRSEKRAKAFAVAQLGTSAAPAHELVGQDPKAADLPK